MLSLLEGATVEACGGGLQMSKGFRDLRIHAALYWRQASGAAHCSDKLVQRPTVVHTPVGNDPKPSHCPTVL